MINLNEGYRILWGGEGLLPCLQELIFRVMVPAQHGGCVVLPQAEIIGGGKGWDASLALPPPPQVMGCKLAQPFWA